MSGVMVCYYKNILITDEQCERLENTGAAHVTTGGSGGVPHCGNIYIADHDTNNAWVILMPGPSNAWIETVEGNCPTCGCPARLHIKKPRGGPPWTIENYDWGTQCTCGCRIDIPHGNAETVLGRKHRDG